MNAPLSTLMQKEVSRGEFLSVIGLAAASILGMDVLLKLLTGKSLEQHTRNKSSLGYGAASYGGTRDSHQSDLQV